MAASESDLLMAEHTGTVKDHAASSARANGDVWGMPTFEDSSNGGSGSGDNGLHSNDSSLANLTDTEWLAVMLGPKNIGLPLLLPITLIYVVIFMSGVTGNIAVCLVIVKNKSMHTATNYYLFSLACSDLMMLVLGLPNDLAIYWQQYPWMLGETMCKGRSLVSEMTSYSSVLTIVAFSMERYLAICHPLYSHTMSGFKRAVRIVFLVWTVSLCAAAPYFLFTRINYIDRPLKSGHFLEDSAFCALLSDNIYPKNYPVHELSSFIFFLFPMGILVILYIRMGLRIRQTSEIQRNLPRQQQQQQQNGPTMPQTGQQSSSSSANNNPSSSSSAAATMAASNNGSFSRSVSHCERQQAHNRRPVLRMLACCACALSLADRSPPRSGTAAASSSGGAGAASVATAATCVCLLEHVQESELDNGGDLCDRRCSATCPMCSETHLTSAFNRLDSDTDSFAPRVRSDKRSVTLLLAAVVFAFFLCWAPFHAQRLCYVYFKESVIFRTINEYLYHVSGFLYYFSATVNPILYNLMSLKYRHAFKQTLCGGGMGSGRRGGGGAERSRSRRQGTQRSYTFRSTTRTVMEPNGSDGGEYVNPRLGGADRRLSCPGKRSGASADERGEGDQASSGRFGCSREGHVREKSKGILEMVGVVGGKRKGRNGILANYMGNRRSNFQAAMRSANNACSDILEEDSSNISTNQLHPKSSDGGGGGGNSPCFKIELPAATAATKSTADSSCQTTAAVLTDMDLSPAITPARSPTAAATRVTAASAAEAIVTMNCNWIVAEDSEDVEDGDNKGLNPGLVNAAEFEGGGDNDNGNDGDDDKDSGNGSVLEFVPPSEFQALLSRGRAEQEAARRRSTAFSPNIGGDKSGSGLSAETSF